MIARSSDIVFLLYLLLMLLSGHQPLTPTEKPDTVYPESLAGQTQDGILEVSANASRTEDGVFYRLEVTITNKTITMVDILADCGNHVTIVTESVKREDVSCVAVHSMGLRKKSSVTAYYDIPPTDMQSGILKLKVRYEDEGVRGSLELRLTAEE